MDAVYNRFLGGKDMLFLRVVSSVVFGLLTLGMLFFFPLKINVALITIFSFIVGTEWAGFARIPSKAIVARFLYAVSFALIPIIIFYLPYGHFHIFLITSIIWLFAALMIYKFPDIPSYFLSPLAVTIFGILAFSGFWSSLYFFYYLPSKDVSLLMLMTVILLIAVDISGYFVGKRFGKHKLIERISPGKTWEGFWGGVVLSLLFAVLFWFLIPSLNDSVSLPLFMAVNVFASHFSLLGDLTESVFKRHSSLKDSGIIMPGHGGVMDRMDSILSGSLIYILFFATAF